VLRLYNETGSLRPKDYGDITWHASYLLALIAAYRNEGIAGALPEEVSEDQILEGAVRQITVNAYERDPKARVRCIAAHGPVCCVCGLDFGEVFGRDFDGLIHVHHLRPLSEIGHEYAIDPVTDLRPVCPNCHALIHHGRQLRSIAEVQQLVAASTRV
jgi:5-methylcytosine-specific restriction protein A